MVKSNEILEELKRIKDLHVNKILKPEDVLESARHESSVLHDRFCWDDTKAAEEYRLWQARQLIATVKIEYDGEVEKHYYHTSVTINDEKVQGYVTAEDFSNEDIYKSVLKEAITSLKYWQKKYEDIKELKDIIDSSKLEEVKNSVDSK